jgi:Homeodomain-like domain
MNTLAGSILLTDSQVTYLQDLFNKGTHSVRLLKRAHILLDLHTGIKPSYICQTRQVSLATVYNIASRYQQVCQNKSVDPSVDQSVQLLKECLQEKARSGQPTKFTQSLQVHLTALACSEPPVGHCRWSLRLLADQLVELDLIDSISHKAVGEQLKKMHLSLG